MSARVKTIVFSLLALALPLLVVELGVLVVFYQTNSHYPLGLIQLWGNRDRVAAFLGPRYQVSRIVADGPLYRADPVVGYSCIPGVHRILYIRKEGVLTSQVVIGEDGYRTTSSSPEAFAGKPEIWIFGCSFTFGDAVNNQDTYPWLLQQQLSDWGVRNYGMSGFGNVQALLQLNDAIEHNRHLPAIAIFAYNYFHPVRNIATDRWLAGIHTLRSGLHEPSDPLYRYARALLSLEGSFTIQFVPLNVERQNTGPDLSNFDRFYSILLTKIIFYRLWEACVSHGITPVFALQTGPPTDPVAQYARTLGFKFVDMSLVTGYLPKRYSLWPYDSHPNKRAHIIYRDRLLAGLLPLLTSRQSP